MVLFVRVLLLPQQFVEARRLLGREHIAKGLFGVKHFLMKLRRYRFHQLAGALLAFADEFADALALSSAKIQVPFDAPQELQPHPPGRAGLRRVNRSGTGP